MREETVACCRPRAETRGLYTNARNDEGLRRNGSSPGGSLRHPGTAPSVFTRKFLCYSWFPVITIASGWLFHCAFIFCLEPLLKEPSRREGDT